MLPLHVFVLIQSEASGLLWPHPEAAGGEGPVRVPSQGRHHTHHLWVARRGPRTPRGPRSQEGVCETIDHNVASVCTDTPCIQFSSLNACTNNCIFLPCFVLYQCPMTMSFLQLKRMFKKESLVKKTSENAETQGANQHSTDKTDSLYGTCWFWFMSVAHQKCCLAIFWQISSLKQMTSSNSNCRIILDPYSLYLITGHLITAHLLQGSSPTVKIYSSCFAQSQVTAYTSQLYM